ncbi:MAG: tetratricopeptide repeat protein [Bacteroidia bacterium]|nr:tetratricopeptide repeat protein [Bacteroidia bacterium]MCC6769020.1 tetratricopeptide repeat protein [Bacteroidia bacterium]
MAGKTENNDPIVNVEDALTKTELFIEKNQKTLLGILGGVILVVGAFMAYREFYVKPLEKEAEEAIFKAEAYFEKDSFNLALNGDTSFTGFLNIIEEYGSTKTGNLAHFYAGICLLNTGKYQEAIDQLDAYSGGDMLTTSFAIGAKGDALMELGKTKEAIDQYVKAAGKEENQMSTPYFLMKAALAYEDQKDYAKAIEIYKKLRTDFFQTNEARDAEKYLARAEGLLQQKSK